MDKKNKDTKQQKEGLRINCGPIECSYCNKEVEIYLCIRLTKEKWVCCNCLNIGKTILPRFPA